jgi:16S rRNA (uracil1498-N3)-methyltransferase
VTGVPAGDRLAVLRRAAAHVLVDDVSAPVLPEAAAHHVFRVLRVAAGSIITVTDGAGRWRVCRALAGDTVEPAGVVEVVAGRARPLTIAVAVPKADRPEWLVQKLTELGVDRIVFLHTERSVVRWDTPRAAKHLAKLRRVAAEALEQSRRVWLPEVTGPVPAATFLPEAVVAEPGGRALTADDRTIAIGPEGGWTAAELASARGAVDLSDAVLRVETAAVAAAVRATATAERRD